MTSKQWYSRIFKSFLAILVIVGFDSGRLLSACPFCGAASLTLAEQIAGAEAVVLGSWLSGERATDDSPGSTIFKIQDVNKSKSVGEGDQLDLPGYRAGRPGDLYILLGSIGIENKLEWSAMEIGEAGYKYLTNAPAIDDPAPKRLRYYLGYLESSDPMVSNDAFAEFANAQYKDVVALTEHFPRENLRKWIQDPQVPATRLGLYGMMLGLCGEESDQKILANGIFQESEDFRLGVDGMMGGYLILTKETGLKELETQKLGQKKLPFSEAFAFMQALRFMWTYGDERISHDRLKESMRLLLKRTDMADLVITDLARWKDWEIQDKLMALYGTAGYNTPSIKRSIIRFLLACSKDLPKEGDAPEHVLASRKNLDLLREKDPKTVADAERFYLPISPSKPAETTTKKETTSN